VATAVAGERSASRNAPVVVNRAEVSGHQATKRARATVSTQLGRVSFAVDGAESSHGADLAMWRPDPSGPQGPMQVSQAAATDVGGGDRFDLTQNHAIGRTYLAQLYRRYRNWPDAIAAYNWGIGNMDAWVNSGRPAEKLPFGVAAYVRRVLHDSGLCDGAEATAINQEAPAASRARRDDSQENAVGSRACIDVDGRDEVLDGKHRYLYGIALSRSHYQLDKVMLSSQHVTPGAQRSTLGSRPGGVARQAARGVAETLTVRAPTSLCRTNPSASFVEHEMDGAGSLVHELPRWLSCQRSGGATQVRASWAS
jgi:hypothetical protein